MKSIKQKKSLKNPQKKTMRSVNLEKRLSSNSGKKNDSKGGKESKLNLSIKPLGIKTKKLQIGRKTKKLRKRIKQESLKKYTNKKSFNTWNPWTGSFICKFNYHGQEEIALKIQNLLGFMNVSSKQRKLLLNQFIIELENEAQVIAELMTQEIGKPIRDSQAEVAKSIDALKKINLRWDFLIQTPEKKFLDQNHPEALHWEIKREKIGIILAVMPFNYPLWQLVRILGSAILWGNPILLKHSELTAGVAQKIEDLFRKIIILDKPKEFVKLETKLDSQISTDTPHTTGLKKEKYGVRLNQKKSPLIEECQKSFLENIRIPISEFENLISKTEIRAITVTGSVAAGSYLGSLAGKYLKKSVMELGGSDAYCIFQDAELDKAAQICAQAKMVNSGQSCIAAKRIFVHHKIKDVFLKKLKGAFLQLKWGNPLSSSTQYSILAHKKYFNCLRDQCHLIETWGCTLLWDYPISKRSKYMEVANRKKGKTSSKNYAVPVFYPRIYEVNSSQIPADFFEMEFFGPVLLMETFNNHEDLIEKVNRSQYGLGMAVFSASKEVFEKCLNNCEVGLAAWNQAVRSDIQFPFGGCKMSGFGRELGLEGLEEFSQIKTIIL